MQPNHDRDGWFLTLVLTKAKLCRPKTESYSFLLDLAAQSSAAGDPSAFVRGADLKHGGSYSMYTNQVEPFQFVLVIDSFGFVVLLRGPNAGKALTY